MLLASDSSATFKTSAANQTHVTRLRAPRAIMPAFALTKDAKLPSPVTVAAWCPTMDLLCVAAKDSSLCALRLNWQKLWVHALGDTSSHDACALAFRPDGKVIAVGYTDGRVSAHAVEDGASLRGTEPTTGAAKDGSGDADGACAVTSMTWVTHGTPRISSTASGSGRDGAAYGKMGSFTATEVAKERAKSSEMFLRTDGTSLVDHEDASGRLNTLCISTADGGFTMRAFGMMPIVHFTRMCSFGAEALAAREDLCGVDAIVKEDNRPGVRRLDTSHIATHAREVHLLVTHAAHAKKTLGRLESIVNEAVKMYNARWQKFMKQMDAFSDSLAMTTDGRSDHLMEELRQRLETVLATGTFDEALEHFFTMSFKIGQVKRMAKDLDAMCTAVHDLLVSEIALLIDALLLRLGSLLALARLGHQAKGIGLDEAHIEEVIKLCEQFALCVMDTARLVTQRAAQLRAFFVFIVRAQIVAEDGDAHGPSLPAPRVDLVQSFLQEVFCVRARDSLATATGMISEAIPTTKSVMQYGVDRLRALAHGQTLHPLCLKEVFYVLQSTIEHMLNAPCDIMTRKCSWTRPSTIEGDVSYSMFSNAEPTAVPTRDSFHVDASNECIHVYRTTANATDSTSMRTLSITTPDEIIVDAAAYKNDRIALLLKPRNIDGSVKARLALLEDGALLGTLPGSTVCINDLDIRSRTLPGAEPLKPLALSSNRGLAAVFVSATRVQLYDLEDDDDSDDDEDDDDDQM